MSIQTLGDNFIEIIDTGTSSTRTISGNLTMIGTVSLPETTMYGSHNLGTLLTNNSVGATSTMDTTETYIESDPTILTIPFSEDVLSTSYSASLSVDAFTENLPTDTQIEYTFGTTADTSGNSQNLTLADVTIISPDPEKGNCIVLKTSNGWSITKSSLISMTDTTNIAPNGTGLTISFDLLFGSTIYSGYNLIQIGRGFNTAGWGATNIFGRVQARGITFTIQNSSIFYVMYVDEIGNYMQAMSYNFPSMALNTWMHIDIVISPENTIADRPATVYINGILIQCLNSTHYWVNNPEPTPDSHSAISSLQFDVGLTYAYFQASPNIVKIAQFRTWFRALSMDELAILNNTNQVTTLIPQVYTRNLSNIQCRFMTRAFNFIHIEKYYNKLKVGCVLSQNNQIILSKNLSFTHLNYVPAYFSSGNNVFPLIDGANNSTILPTYQAIGISTYVDSPTIITSSTQFGSLYKMTSNINDYRSTYGYSTTVCRLPLTPTIVNSLNDTSSSKKIGLSYVIQNSKTETTLPQFDTEFAVGSCDKLDTHIDEKLIYIIKIASGKNHVLFLTNIGTVYACGDNTYGQLGNGNLISQNYPVQVCYSNSTIVQDAIDIAAGGNHSMFLKRDGQVATCGLNTSGQCGTGVANSTNILYPTLARLVLNSTTITGICEISAGENHSLFRHYQNFVYACGLNNNGQLGDGTIVNKSVGTTVKLFGTTNLVNIRSISAGYNHSIFITNDNNVLSCGDNTNGQLGDSTTISRNFPVVVNLNSTRLVSNYIDYTFTTLNDSSTKGSSTYGNLVVSGSGTVLASDSEFSYILAPAASTLVSSTIEPTSNSSGLIVNYTTGGSGLTISFDLKLNATTYGNTQYIFAIGDPVSVLATPPAASSSAATAGISFRMLSATQLSVLLTVNGSIAASQIITSAAFTTTTWTNITFILNNTLVDGSIGYSAYVNGIINADIRTKPWTVTGSNIVNSLDISNNTLGGYNKIAFYGSANSHKVANFRIWRSDNINNLKILTNINAVSAGQSHSAFLTNTGIVYTSGLNSDGRLGNGTTTNSLIPVKVKSSGTTTDLADIKAISAGSLHTIFLTKDGTVYSCGSNASNQLGTTLAPSFFINPTILSSQKITMNGVDSFVSLSDTITGISAGFGNSIFLKNDDTVYSCGDNTYGQLGDGTNTSRSQAVQLRSLVALYLDLSNQSNVTITKTARGDNHTLFLGQVNTQPPLIKVWGCGRNYYAELGLGYADTSNPTLYPEEITTLNYKDITDIGGMDIASVFLSYKNGTSTVYTCGGNDGNGRQMDGTSTIKNVVFPTVVSYFNDKQIKQINSSWAAILLLSETGAVYASGYNNLGQLATNNTTVALSPVQCRDTATTFISNIVDISTGRHTMFVRSDGTVWGCGNNNYGQLGINSTTGTLLPVQVQSVTGGFLQNIIKVRCGDNHTLFLTNDGKVYACGIADNGRLGNNASSGNVTRATLIPIDAYITDIATSDVYSLFGSEFSKIPESSPYKTSQLTSYVYACGSNTDSLLGMGNQDAVIVPTIIPSLSGVAISNLGGNARVSRSILVVGASGTVYVWGDNTYGELGLRDIVKRVYPHPPQIPNRQATTTTIDGFHVDIFDKMNLRITQVVTGSAHSLFLGTTLTGESKVYGCGYNGYGQLGVNDRIDKTYPVEITALNNLGITEIAAGDNFSVFLSTTNNRVYACGRSIYGSFGAGTNTADTNYPIVPIEISDLRGKNIITIRTGELHSLFLSSDTTVWCCGYNASGALGINSTTNAVIPTQVLYRVGIPLTGVTDIAAGRRHSIFLLNTGLVLTVGLNDSGQLGNGNTTQNAGFPTPVIFNNNGVGSSNIIKNIVKIAAGYYHSLFLSKDGLVFGCGSQLYGRLGDGVTGTSSVTGGVFQIHTFNNLKISDIQCAFESSLFLSASRGRVYACGRNNTGQLGDGTTTDRELPTEVSTFNNISIESLGVLGSSSKHCGAISTEGKVYLWGENDNGRLGGIDDTGQNKLYPEIRTITEYPNMDKLTVLKMAIGYRYTILIAIVNGITTDKRVFTCGSNNFGQLGDGTTTNLSYPTEITSLRYKNINDVVCGEEHSLFISYNSDVTPIVVDLYGCGRNDVGQLGNGSTVNVSLPVNLTYILQGQPVKKIIAGNHQTYFLKVDKTAMVCGYNNLSQLSIGNTINQIFPVSMLQSAGTVFTNIHDIAIGLENTFIIKENVDGSKKGTVWGVGRNDYGMLSINSVTNNTTGYPIKCTTSDGIEINNITKIAAGHIHTIFLSDENNGNKYIYTCGHQNSGRLGNNVNSIANITRATLISTAYMTQAIQNSITDIQAGETYSLFYSSITQRLYSCGANSYGQLGDGTLTNLIVPTLQPFFNDLNIIIVANIARSALNNGVVYSNGTVSMWGLNDNGQLGVNDTANRPYPEIITYMVSKNVSTTTTMIIRISTNVATYDFVINNYPYTLNITHRIDMSIDNRVVYCYLDGIKSSNSFTLPCAIDITENPNIRVFQRESKTSQQFGQIKFWTKQITSKSFIRASYNTN